MCLDPGGMRENRFQRWVNEPEAISNPGGGTEELVSRPSFAPFGAWSVRDTSTSAIKLLGYSRPSLWNWDGVSELQKTLFGLMFMALCSLFPHVQLNPSR
jgi:hypothetical protein